MTVIGAGIGGLTLPPGGTEKDDFNFPRVPPWFILLHIAVTAPETDLRH